MTNLQLMLLLGALLGWGTLATDRHFKVSAVVRTAVSGAVGSFIGALIAQGGTLYSAPTLATWGGAVAGALICAGLAGLMRLPHPD